MNKIFILVAVIILGVLFFYFKPPSKQIFVDKVDDKSNSQSQPSTSDQKPNVISTKPDLNNEPTILPTQVLTFTFNTPLENRGEFKIKFDPDFGGNYTVDLSSDKKVATVTPNKPFALGMLYTVTIGTDSKFDNKQRLEHEFIYHFKTIQYKGV